MTYITLDLLEERLVTRPPKRAVPAPGTREAAVALILTSEPGPGLGLLFIKRAEHPGDPWSGQMALPGGRRDDSDTELLATAIREVQEETAINLSGARRLGELDDLTPVSPNLPPIVVRPFVFGLVARPAVVESEEVALHVWVRLHDLPASRATETIRVRSGELLMPGYRVGAHFIWGMTERIVTPFLELVAGS